MPNVRLLAAALLLAGSFTLLADEPAPATNAPSHAAKSRNKVYSVADLVVPIRNDVVIGDAPVAAPRTCEDRLIDLITSKVQPRCWTKAGGPCVIQFYPIGMGLVVNGPDDVQAEVAATLDSLRKSQDATVNVGLQFMTVSSEFLERFGLDKDLNIDAWQGCDCCGPNCCCRCGATGLGCICPDCDCDDCCGCCLEPQCCPETTPIGLSPRQAALLLDAVKADGQACITHTPRVAMTDGQSATVTSQEYQLFVTGLKIESVDGEVHALPQVTQIKLGLSTTMHASISADRRYVGLHLDSSYACLENDEVPMSTVHVNLASSKDGNQDHSAMEFAHAIQRPKVRTLTIDSDLHIPSGGTMLVYGGQINRTQHVECSVPVLGKLPGLGQLFTHTWTEPTTDHLLVLVTPQIASQIPDQSVRQASATSSETVHGAACPTANSACPMISGGCDACPNCLTGKCVKCQGSCPAASEVRVTNFKLNKAPAAIVATQIQDWCALRYNDENIVRLTFDSASNTIFVQAPVDVGDWVMQSVAWLDTNWIDGTQLQIIKLRNVLSDELATTLNQMICDCPTGSAAAKAGQATLEPRFDELRFIGDCGVQSAMRKDLRECVRFVSEPRSNCLIVTSAPKYSNLVATIAKDLDVVAAARPVQVNVHMLKGADASHLAALLRKQFVKDESGTVLGACRTLGGGCFFCPEPGKPVQLETRITVDERTNILIATGNSSDLRTIESMIACVEYHAPVRMRLVFKIRRAAAADVATTVQTFFTNSLGLYARKDVLCDVVCVPESVSNTVLVDTTPQFADDIKRIIDALDFVPGGNCGGMEEASAPAARAACAKSPVEQRAAKKAESLVQKYHEACSKGDAEGARVIAREALDLDPECFSKPHEPIAQPSECPCKQACPTCPTQPSPVCPQPVGTFQFAAPTSQIVGCVESSAPPCVLLYECQQLPGTQFPVNSFRLVPSCDPLVQGESGAVRVLTSNALIQPAFGLPQTALSPSHWAELTGLLPRSTCSDCGSRSMIWLTPVANSWSTDAWALSSMPRTTQQAQSDSSGAGCLEPEECEPPQETNKDWPLEIPFQFGPGVRFQPKSPFETPRPMKPPER
jgi:type II secretory pathway component GspD/PulD (secretin)